MINLTAEFAHFNQILFDGALPVVPVKFEGRMKRNGGTCKYLRNRFTNTFIEGSAVITIAGVYRNDIKAVKAILIHEMIHLYFAINNRFDEGHGFNFRAMAKKFSEIVGFTIPVDHCVFDHEVIKTAARKKPVGVMIATKKNGRMSFAVMTAKLAATEGENIKNRLISYGAYEKVLINITDDQKVLKLSHKVSVNRKFGKSFTFYVMDDDAAEALGLAEQRQAA